MAMATPLLACKARLDLGATGPDEVCSDSQGPSDAPSNRPRDRYAESLRVSFRNYRKVDRTPFLSARHSTLMPILPVLARTRQLSSSRVRRSRMSFRSRTTCLREKKYQLQLCSQYGRDPRRTQFGISCYTKPFILATGYGVRYYVPTKYKPPDTKSKTSQCNSTHRRDTLQVSRVGSSCLWNSMALSRTFQH
jgi:hypothetical protein